MPHPQQPELRRSDKGAGTPEDGRSLKATEPDTGGGRPHGTDRGDKGGGEGGELVRQPRPAGPPGADSPFVAQTSARGTAPRSVSSRQCPAIRSAAEREGGIRAVIHRE